MREIKYRVWDKTKGKMASVADINFGDDGSAKTTMIQPAPKGTYYHGLVEGENCTLMQFTGLQDRQGKDIYEGDIIQRPHVSIPMMVRWNKKNACFDLTMRDPEDFDSTTIWYTQFASRDYEVLGNIYETPELLEVK